MTALCIGDHDEAPTPEPGLLLCRRCLTRLRRDLDTITVCWSLLSEIAEPSRSVGGGSHGKRPDPPAPANLDVLDATDPRTSQIIAAMGWARITVEDLRLSALPSDVAECATLLIRHLDWVGAQPWADEACDEIGKAARSLRWICGDAPEPPLGHCPDIDPRGEADRCGGPLRWDDGTLDVVCARCGSRWTSLDLPNLLRVVEPSRRFPVPRTWVANRYGVAGDVLRQWIRRGHVKTYHDEQVELFDVLKRITEG